MLTTIATLLRLIPRDVTVICGSQAISLSYAQRSPRGRCTAHADLPYELALEAARERVSHFRFHVARLRYRASRS